MRDSCYSILPSFSYIQNIILYNILSITMCFILYIVIRKWSYVWFILGLTTNEITELFNNINPKISDFEIEDEEDNYEDLIISRPATPTANESSSDSENDSVTLAEVQCRAVIWRHKDEQVVSTRDSISKESHILWY